jgi:hypothetical protein
VHKGNFIDNVIAMCGGIAGSLFNQIESTTLMHFGDVAIQAFIGAAVGLGTKKVIEVKFKARKSRENE